MRKTSVNTAYKKIEDMGLMLEPRTANMGYNTLYLTNKNGERVTPGVKYRSNKQSHIYLDFKFTVSGTYKDQAMIEALEQLKEVQ